MKERGLLTIKNASELTDLPPSTLRFWEKEFSEFLIPVRTKGGQRRYRKDDISLILTIKRLHEGPLTLAEIKRHMFKAQSGRSTESQTIDALAACLGDMAKQEIYKYFKTVNWTGLNDYLAISSIAPGNLE